MQDAILELCEEDDYGSWELWWRVVQNYQNEDTNQLRSEFIQTIQRLIAEGKILAKRYSGECFPKLKEVAFDGEVLMDEIRRSDHPDPNAFYWFGK